MRVVLANLVLAAAALSAAQAADTVAVEDRAAIETCLATARREGTPREKCIGIVSGACIDKPGGNSTVGMKDCTGREIDVWDERLNSAYRKLISGSLGRLDTQRAGPGGKIRKVKGADILRDAQRAWIAARERKCDAAALPMEGGTGAGLLSTSCYLDETARQALWLEDLAQEN
jgi:uncharacterized protein YecT (DUF1311 family)